MRGANEEDSDNPGAPYAGSFWSNIQLTALLVLQMMMLQMMNLKCQGRHTEYVQSSHRVGKLTESCILHEQPLAH